MLGLTCQTNNDQDTEAPRVLPGWGGVSQDKTSVPLPCPQRAAVHTANYCTSQLLRAALPPMQVYSHGRFGTTIHPPQLCRPFRHLPSAPRLSPAGRCSQAAAALHSRFNTMLPPLPCASRSLALPHPQAAADMLPRPFQHPASPPRPVQAITPPLTRAHSPAS